MVWRYAWVWSVAQTAGLSIKSFSPEHIDHAVGDRSEDSFIKCNLWKAHRSHIGWSNISVAHQKLTKILPKSKTAMSNSSSTHCNSNRCLLNIKAREQVELTPIKRDVACNRTHSHRIPNYRRHHVCKQRECLLDNQREK